MYIYVFMYTLICMRVYKRSVDIYMHTYIRIYTCTYVLMYMCVYVYVYTYVYLYTDV